MEGPLRQPDLKLIETLRWDGSRLVREERHRARLRRSAATLGFPHDETRVAAALATARGDEPLRVRLTLDGSGRVEVTTAPLPAVRTPWRVALAPERLRSDASWLRLKSTARGRYDAARAALAPDLDEMFFANERGEVCEGTITNIFFDLGGGLATPPVTCGLLPGVLREEMLATGRCIEAKLRLEDLAIARLWAGNSLRGLLPCVLSAKR